MRNMIVLASVLGMVSFLGVPLAGCDGGDGTGGGGGDGGSGGGGVTVAGACQSLSAAVCGNLDKCSPFLLEITYGDAATCEARVNARCDDPTELDASNLTAEDIDACATAYEARTCEDLFAPAPSVCRVPGAKDAGATCATASECKSTFCQTDAEGSCGACGTLLAEGASCPTADDVCELGLYCNPSSVKCEKPAAKGEACGQEKLCASGLSCNAGTCGALQGNGADCSAGQACDITQGLICFILDKTCRKVVIAELGEACGYDMDTDEISVCGADARCDDANKCAARPVEGEACTVDADSGDGDCATGYDCLAGECAAALPQCN